MKRTSRPVLYLMPGAKFHTCLTNRPGIVLAQDRDEGTGVAVMLNDPPERKLIFEDCLVFPDVILPTY